MNLLAVVEGVGQWSDDQEDEREGVTFIPVEVSRTNRGKVRLVEGEQFRAVIDERFPAEFWNARLGAVVLLSGNIRLDSESGWVVDLASIMDPSSRAESGVTWKG